MSKTAKTILTVAGLVIGLILAAMAINVFMPNAVAQVSNAVEDTLFKGTGMAFDLNGDGNNGSNDASYGSGATGTSGEAGTVEGFK